MAAPPRWEFDWDAANLRHLARHRVTREEFEQAMNLDPIFMDVGDEAGEERWYALGPTSALRVLFLVFTLREGRVRPVTGWTASRKLREMYFRQKAT